ncbi:hypothetical protein TNCT_215731 [Trichonephila clavata]|uniref:Uncharacterized protein n=1 Tax=Trichonephila clavata TaxID=2740835 RepID=A0A8X6K5T1_TRICU|nr:hypothetical protein TNCT_215731 [Trichonephila clavata]
MSRDSPCNAVRFLLPSETPCLPADPASPTLPNVSHHEIRVSVPTCFVVADHLLRVRHHRRMLQETRRNQRMHQTHRLQQQRCVCLHW